MHCVQEEQAALQAQADKAAKAAEAAEAAKAEAEAQRTAAEAANEKLRVSGSKKAFGCFSVVGQRSSSPHAGNNGREMHTEAMMHGVSSFHCES